MFKSKLIAAAALALGTVALAPTAALAQVDFSVVIGNAPPPLRFESVPPARYGYVWAPGVWRWDGQRHVWMAGHWLQERPGYRYAPRNGCGSITAGAGVKAAGPSTTAARATSRVQATGIANTTATITTTAINIATAGATAITTAFLTATTAIATTTVCRTVMTATVTATACLTATTTAPTTRAAANGTTAA